MTLRKTSCNVSVTGEMSKRWVGASKRWMRESEGRPHSTLSGCRPPFGPTLSSACEKAGADSSFSSRMPPLALTIPHICSRFSLSHAGSLPAFPSSHSDASDTRLGATMEIKCKETKTSRCAAYKTGDKETNETGTSVRSREPKMQTGESHHAMPCHAMPCYTACERC